MRSFAVAISMLLVLSACAQGADDVAVTTTVQDVDFGASTTSTSPVATTTIAPATTTTVPTTTTVAGTVIRVVLEGGEVTVNGQTVVPVGEQVTIRVRADVEGVVQISDLDVSADLSPGSVAVLRFTPEEAGTFSVALDNGESPLFELEVSE
jgi:hypothetical protein